MQNLPRGWDIDYDGTRWFYEYRSSGLVQYTFPKDGDEFPEYVDDTAPALTLAPEERLESQQQMRRKGHKSRRGTASVMGSTGGLESTAWEDDGEEDEQFHPESFMYLGPGAYADVSPLAEGENLGSFAGIANGKRDPPATEPAATTLDATWGRFTVLPPVSSVSTPPIPKGTPVEAATEPGTPGNAPAEPAAELAVFTPPPVTVTPVESGTDKPSPPEMDVPMLDSRKRSHGLPEAPNFDPVGFMAEMPTEATAAAHIELHPDPVEIGDNTVLAPIETFFMNAGIAELPSHSSPVVCQSETKQPPSQRQTGSPPTQRAYPFQPTEKDDGPNRGPAPPGSASSSQTPCLRPPSTIASQEQNRAFSPSPPSAASISEPTTPLPSTATNPSIHALVAQVGIPGSQPQSARPESPFKIARKPTNARTNSRFMPWSPGTDSSKSILHGGGQPLAGQPSGEAAAPPGHPQALEERSHSSPLPESERSTAQLPPHPGIVKWQGVPSALQPGASPSATTSVLSKGKGKAPANPNPVSFAQLRSILPRCHALGQVPPSMTPGPKSPAGLNSIGASSPAETTASTNTQATISPQSAPGIVNTPVRPAGPNHAPRAGASSDSQSQDQHQGARSTGFLGKASNGQQQGPAPVGQSHQQSVAGSYFPPQPSVDSRMAQKPGLGEAADRRLSLPPERLNYMMGGPQPRPQATTHGSQLGAPRPEQQPDMTPRPQQPKQPFPSQHLPPFRQSLGHPLHSISEQPDHEDAATRAIRVARLSSTSNHRRSMPIIPLGQASAQGGNVPGVAALRMEMTVPNGLGQPPPSQQQQGPGQGYNSPPNAQSQMGPGKYAQPLIQLCTGPPAGLPLTLPPHVDNEPTSQQAPEKGKSKWFSKFLKPSKAQQKPAPRQQQIWQGPDGLFIPPAPQPSGLGAPWSPGSIGAPMSLPASGAARSQPDNASQQGGTAVQMQRGGVSPGFLPMNTAQMHQRRFSGGGQMAAPDVLPPGQQTARGNTRGPAQGSTATEVTSRRQPDVISNTPSPQPSQTKTHSSPPNPQQAQPAVDAGFIRTESVRSDFSTMDVSEAQAQPVLRPQLVQVSRRASVLGRPRRQPQINGSARPGQSSLPQTNGSARKDQQDQIPWLQYPIPQGPEQALNGKAPERRDCPKVVPIVARKGLSTSGTGSSMGESII